MPAKQMQVVAMWLLVALAGAVPPAIYARRDLHEMSAQPQTPRRALGFPNGDHDALPADPVLLEELVVEHSRVAGRALLHGSHLARNIPSCARCRIYRGQSNGHCKHGGRMYTCFSTSWSVDSTMVAADGPEMEWIELKENYVLWVESAASDPFEPVPAPAPVKATDTVKFTIEPVPAPAPAKATDTYNVTITVEQGPPAGNGSTLGSPQPTEEGSASDKSESDGPGPSADSGAVNRPLTTTDGSNATSPDQKLPSASNQNSGGGSLMASSHVQEGTGGTPEKYQKKKKRKKRIVE